MNINFIFFSLNKNDYNIPLFKFLRIEIEYLPTMFIILTFLSLAYAMITTIIKYFYIRNSYCKKCSIELDIVALMEVKVTKYQGGSTKVGEAVSRETGESFDIYQDSYSEIDVIEKAAIYQCSKCKKNHLYLINNSDHATREIGNFKLLNINDKRSYEANGVLNLLLKNNKINAETHSKLNKNFK